MNYPNLDIKRKPNLENSKVGLSYSNSNEESNFLKVINCTSPPSCMIIYIEDFLLVICI